MMINSDEFISFLFNEDNLTIPENMLSTLHS